MSEDQTYWFSGCLTICVVIGTIFGGAYSCTTVAQQEATKRVVAVCGVEPMDTARAIACAQLSQDAHKAGQ